MDLPAPTLQPQEKLLIDLTNTPDLIRTNNKACTATQVNILALMDCFYFAVMSRYLYNQPVLVFFSAADRPELSAHQVESRRQEGEQRSAHQPVLLIPPTDLDGVFRNHNEDVLN